MVPRLLAQPQLISLKEAIGLAQRGDEANLDEKLRVALQLASSTADSVRVYYLVARYHPTLSTARKHRLLDAAIAPADSTDKHAARSWHVKAYLYVYVTSDYLAAEEAYLNALALYQQNEPQSSRIAHCAKDVGNIYSRFGDYRLAIYHLRQAVAGYREKGLLRYQAQAMADLAVALWAFGREDAARDTARHVCQLPQLSSYEIGLAHQVLGAYWQQKEVLDSAEVHFQLAIQAFEQYEVEPDKFEYLAESLTSLGAILQAQQKPKAAFLTCDKARSYLSLAFENSFRREVSKWHIAYGVALCKAEKWDQALFHFQMALYRVLPQAIDTLDVTKNFPVEDIYQENVLMEALEGKAKAWLGKFQEAKEEPKNTLYLRLALDALDLCYTVEDHFRESFRFESSRLRLAADRHRRVELSLEAIAQLSKPSEWLDKAFGYMERSKALSLLEELRDDQYRQAYFSEKIRYTWGRLERKLAALQASDAPEEQLTQAELEIAQFTKSLARQFPDYYQFKYQMELPPLKRIRAELSDQQAVVVYFWGERAIYALPITRDDAQLVKLGAKQAITQHFTTIQSSLQQTAAPIMPSAYGEAAHALFTHLISPIQQLPEEVLIIPDGALARLPFEALLSKKPEAEATWRNLPYWVNEKYISYAWSYSLWQQAQGHATGRVIAISPQKFPTLPALPQGEKIIKNLKDIYGSQMTSLIGDQATKNQFLASVSEGKEPPQILHFHTHAQASSTNPSDSWISFRDEKMYLHEVYHHRLNAAMAVLGACETADGQLQVGEGVMSFARGFTHAGCQSVVGTLWAADEHTTTELLINFYDKLHQGKAKHKALTQSKRSLLQANSSRPNIAFHPKNWASLVLIGNRHALFVSRSYWPWLIGICILLGAIWVWKKN